MSWQNIVKQMGFGKHPANLNDSYDNILYWGITFDELGWLGVHDAWFYFGKPHKWQYEYEIMLNVMRYVDENLQDEVGDYDDPLAISEYLYDEGVRGGADEWEKWLKEKQKGE
tara:strand:+ start:7900 stop:8238 length:339 start_codon:yes stop_codon:yes gene_type:complete